MVVRERSDGRPAIYQDSYRGRRKAYKNTEGNFSQGTLISARAITAGYSQRGDSFPTQNSASDFRFFL